MAYTAFLADPSHREAIARLWSDNMSDRQIATALDRRLHWLYDDARAGGVRTWLVKKDDTNEVVGCASMCPRNVAVDGRTIRAGLLSDFAIARAHRVAGPAIVLQRKLVSDASAMGFDMVFGHPNRNAIPIFRRIGYEQVGTISSWAKPLLSEKHLRKRMHPWMARLLSPAADRILRANDLRLLLRHGVWFRDLVLDRADARFDDLWERGKHDKPATVQRSSDYLNWRYADFTTARFHIFAITERTGSRLRGYVIWREHHGLALVADVFWDGGSTVLGALLIRFARHARKHGCESVHLIVLGDRTLLPSLHALQFYPATPDDRPVVAWAGGNPPDHLRVLLSDPARWQLFDGDLDL